MKKNNNNYHNLKNYELEELFDLSQKEKNQLSDKLNPKKKHHYKLQEFYLKGTAYQFNDLEQEINTYFNQTKYLLNDTQIGLFYECLAYYAHINNDTSEEKYLNLTIDHYPTLFSLKLLIYKALINNNIHKAARLILIALEFDIEFDNQLSYYNLIVEHYFADDIRDYFTLMEEFKSKFISVDNITIEFSFNKLIANYYIKSNFENETQKEILQAKKEINELLLKTISSMKDEEEMRSEVLRVRTALDIIETDVNVNIFELISFKLLPKPSGIPTPLELFIKK